ncbi:MAG: tetratricopeptide repeat protein [Bacteroidota bacterium]
MRKHIAIVFFLSCFVGFISIQSCDLFNKKNNDKKDATLSVTDTTKGAKLTLLDAEIKKNPSNPNLYQARAIELMHVNRLDDALKDMYYASMIDSFNTDYYFTIADIYIEKGDGKKAVLSLEKAVSIAPERADLKVEVGRYCLYMKEYEKSLMYLNEALKQDVYNADAYFLKGILFKETNNEPKAISNFQTCIEQDPKYTDAYIQLGMLYAGKKDEIALRYFDNAIKVDPTATDALYQKAMFIQNKKEYTKAIDLYKDMVPVDPKNEHIFYNIGYCYFQMDSIAKAHKNFGIAIELNPQYAEAYYNRGLCALAKNDLVDAQYNFDEALRLKPDMKEASEALATIKKQALK